jgi:DNA polymerase (family 10)
MPSALRGGASSVRSIICRMSRSIPRAMVEIGTSAARHERPQQRQHDVEARPIERLEQSIAAADVHDGAEYRPPTPGAVFSRGRIASGGTPQYRAMRRRISNEEVVRALREMALFLEIDEAPFKPQAYERAAHAVAALDRPLAEVHAKGGAKALAALTGIGKGIAQRIAGLLESGEMADLEARRREMPVDIMALTAIEGLGPKKVRTLWEALDVRSVADLRRAAESGQIRELPHFGERSERKILEAIDFVEQTAGRRPLGKILEPSRRIEAALAKVPGVSQATIAGSIRRRCETVGDVDVLVASSAPQEVSRAFERLPEVEKLVAQGPTKTVARLVNGLDADLRVVAPESFGAALIYFTGSKAHNVALRKIALAKQLKLNEYGLFRGDERVAGRTEEEVYAALGMQWVPPELREDTGEIQLALRGELPVLVEARDIRGDLQMHTTWTDGSVSIEEMARAARALGLDYIAITDHTQDLPLLHGLDEARLREQIAAIRAADRAIDGIEILAGAEVNIRPDGSLDVSDDVLAELDIVGAAIHSHFGLSRDAMTKRIVRAVEHPHVDILFHPTTRKIGRRRPLDFDFEAVVAACRRTGTILEIDAQPHRLDLPDTMARYAMAAGVVIAIDSDAHSTDELRFVEDFGVCVARRAGLEARHVLNTLAVDDMLRVLKG